MGRGTDRHEEADSHCSLCEKSLMNISETVVNMWTEFAGSGHDSKTDVWNTATNLQVPSKIRFFFRAPSTKLIIAHNNE